jgi:signal transduction histidine kinase
MARWVDELHEASRLQVGGDLRLDREPFDLVGLVRSLVEEHQRLAPDHRLAVEAAEEEIVGHWDRGRVERVVDNLVGNAVKYSPAGRVVEIEVGQAEGWAILQVRDQGIGIPAADVPHLFDLFRRGSNVADRMPGSGIGLAVVRAAVERHGGTIEVASAPGVGSTFTVRLPLTGAVDNGSLPYR